MTREREPSLLTGSSWWDRHPRLRWPVAIAFAIYIIGGSICFTIAMLRVQ